MNLMTVYQRKIVRKTIFKNATRGLCYVNFCDLMSRFIVRSHLFMPSDEKFNNLYLNV